MLVWGSVCNTELNLELTNKELEKIRAEADALKMNSSKVWGTTHNTERHVQWVFMFMQGDVIMY